MKKKSIKINAVLNMIKQFSSVLFPLITVPYVSRVLEAANYGKVNFGNSIVSYFALIAGLGISNYAIREGARIREDRKQISKFANEVFTINVASALISYFILIVLLQFSVKLQNYRLLIMIQSMSILFTTAGADWINMIYEDYFYITSRYLIMQCLSIGCMFLFVKTPEDYLKYAGINVIATTGGNIFNLFYIRKYVHLELVRIRNWKEHLKPIIILFFNAIATTIYVNSDITILGILQTEEAVGIYGLSTKIYLVIKQVLNSLIIVSLPRLSAYLGENDETGYKLLANKIINGLCTIVFPAMAGLFMLSYEITLIVGGGEYAAGYRALRILGVSLGFAVLGCFYCCAVMIPFKKEKICLAAAAVSAFMNIGLNFVFIPIISYDGAALTTMVSEIVVFLIYFLSSKKYSGAGCSKKVMISSAAGCCYIVFVCLGCKALFSDTVLVAGSSIIASGTGYLVIQFLLKNPIIEISIETAVKAVKEKFG